MGVTENRQQRRRLSDAALWTIVCQPEVSAPQLARQFDVTVGAVRSARYRFRREGWSCRVAYLPCGHCGQTMTVRSNVRKDHVYHVRCRPAARALINHRLDVERWAAMTPEARAASIRRKERREREKNATALAKARQHHQRWSDDEDAVILEADYPATDLDLALALGRSVFAVRNRRRWLRHRKEPTTDS